MRKAIKVFDFEEGTQSDMSYRIDVYHQGKLVDTFQKPTMQMTIDAFRAAGYSRMSCL